MQHNVALCFSDGQTRFIKVGHNDLLMDAAFRNGITLPVDCREGVCGTCRGLCESGQYQMDYVDEEALTPSELQARHVLSCQTRVQSDCTFYYDFDASLCLSAPARTLSAQVSRLLRVSDDTAILFLQLSGSSPMLEFLPGQYANLEIPGTEIQRAYSFANRPDPSNQLQFLIRMLPGGQMGQYLEQRCQVGDEVKLTGPYGAFYRRQSERPLYFLAGGTGLSAFLAMLDDMLGTPLNVPVRLFYGVNRQQDLCELERLQRYKDQLPDFDFLPVVSQPDEGWAGATGFVQQHLPLSVLQAQPFDMYLCGPPPMIDAVRQWCDQSGLAHGRLYAEKFIAPGAATPA